jgi:hypothetical protein
MAARLRAWATSTAAPAVVPEADEVPLPGESGAGN